MREQGGERGIGGIAAEREVWTTLEVKGKPPKNVQEREKVGDGSS